MRRLTDDEQRIVEEHYDSGGGLVGWFIHKENLEYDDWHGTISTSLINSVKSYDECKGNFSTYFHKVARNDMLMEYRKETELTGFSDSIENEQEESISGSDFYLFEYYDLIDRLDSRARKIAYMLLDGNSQYEIASTLGLTDRTIRSEVSKLRGTLKEWMR